MSTCTCGPFWSVVPPGPCPIHDAENYYWHMKARREFGQQYLPPTNNTVPIRPTGAIWVTL